MKNKKDDHVYRRSHHGSRNDGRMRKRYKRETTAAPTTAAETTKETRQRQKKTTEAAGAELSGSISMSGSTSMEKVGNALAESFMEKYPDVTVTVEFTGSSAGVEAALLQSQRHRKLLQKLKG